MGSERSELPAYQQARRRRIVEAASAMLEGQEYERIQIREVAERAGVALGTLYRYFSSKEHLYAAVMVDWAEPFREAGRPEDGERPPQERIRRRLHLTIRAFEKYPNFHALESVMQSTSDANAARLFAEFNDRNMGAYRAELAGLGADLAADISAVLTAVMARELMAFILGWKPIGDVYRLVDRAVDLVFSPLPVEG
ncbi:TetR/AcrR family transcriptional regulator [Spirillospora sp. NPDC029432]|uniref:TetR/AcrR family transcriptional regulator n=1 Tax=Spirillospora sp. NPDC029432 TaxID=3154599 RepID=UPI0034559FA8